MRTWRNPLTSCLRLRSARLVSESLRISERPLTLLSLFFGRSDHRLHHWHQLALSRCKNLADGVRLLPEDLPIELVGSLCAIQLRFAGDTAAARQELP